MIPPLVALIATVNEPSQRTRALATLEQLKQQGRAEPLGEPITPEIEQLPQLATRRLVSGTPDSPDVGQLLGLLTPEQLIPSLRSQSEAMSVCAGLYLIHDYLNEAHQLAQAADDLGSSTTAAYWHGIVHRREPDYDNARYWFRRVGSHPVFVAVAREAKELISDSAFQSRLQCDRVLDRHGRWDAMAFIDLCQECGRDWSDRARAAACLQEIEMRRLLEYTCAAAQGQA
jgi:hypothetical protein